MKTTFISLLLILVVDVVEAQTDMLASMGKAPTTLSRETWASISPETAYFLAQTGRVPNSPLKACSYRGITLRIGTTLPSTNIYSRIYPSAMFGIGSYFSYFSTKQIGNPVALYGWFDIPFYKEGKWRLSYYGSLGLSANFHPYNNESNKDNRFIGSTTNCQVALFLNAYYDMASRWRVGLGVGFRHFSNGGMRLPNLGINMFPLHATVAYRFSRQKQTINRFDSLPVFQPYNLLNISTAFGGKQFRINGNRYLKTELSANYLHQNGYKYRVGGGMDVFFSQGVASRDSSLKPGFKNSVSVAATANAEWLLQQRLSIPVALGVYLKRNKCNGESTPYYARVGLKYMVTKHVFTALTIKAHGGVADFFEWTIGCSLFKDKNRYKM